MCRYCDFFSSINFDINLLENFQKIFVLVSGGIDSTLLYEYIFYHYPEKTYPVNAFNPYEVSDTLKVLRKKPRYIEIKTSGEYNYAEVLKNAFLKIPEARKQLRTGNYGKKIFGCCYIIKHKAFLRDNLFKQDGTVIISGIKAGDGTQRRLWLHRLREGGKQGLHVPKTQVGFFHKHDGGQLYCYPFRDY